jgi:hypothetical protein
MSTITQPAPPKPAARGWFSRNWKWFLPATIGAAIALAGITAFAYIQVRSYRYRQNPAYQTALAEVQANKQVQDLLGEPIVDSDWNPQGGYDRHGETITGARFNFTVSGPRGHAEVTTEARVVDAQWAVSRLELLTVDGERIRLTKQVLAKQKVDTPAFDPAAQKQGDSSGDDPPKETTDVNVQVPDLPPELK